MSNEKSTYYSLWKATKNLKRPTSQISPILDNEGGWVRTSQQKVELFATHLENIFQPNGEEDTLPPLRKQQERGTIKLTSPIEVNKEIMNKNESKKPPEYDLITGQILKKLPKKAVIKAVKVDMVETVINKFAVSYEHRLHQRVNIEAIQLLDTTDNIRRLKRTKPHELAWS